MLSQDSFYRNLTGDDLKDVQSEGQGQGQGRQACLSKCGWATCRLWRQPGPPAPAPSPHPAALLACPPATRPTTDYNFDHPQAFDMDSILKCLHELRVRAAPAAPGRSAAGPSLHAALCIWPAHTSHALLR